MNKLVLGMMLLGSMTALAKDYSQYKSDVLVSAKQAKEIMDTNKNSVVIDIRPAVKYTLGHIPGAFNMWRPDMEPKDKRYGEIGGMRASREELAQELSKMGANEDTTIILTGELDDLRLWWLLDMYGHKNLKVIDGGLDAWKNAGFDTTMRSTSNPAPSNYKFSAPTDKDTLADLAEVKMAIDNPDYVILDTRDPGEFDGSDLKKGAFKKGRIPTDYFINWKKALNSDGTFKSAEELQKLYAAEGITSEKNVINYCQSGVRSAHTTFVLRELLGFEDSKNYDGSWIEYSYEADKQSLPIETGAANGKHKALRKN